LQFIAPLIHAHTNEKALSHGIHLPHFEHYSNANPLASDELSCKVTAFHNALEGQIVGVHTGLSRLPALLAACLLKKVADNNHSDYLPVSMALFQAIVVLPRVIITIQTIVLFEQFIHSPQSPRAPPSQTLS
jgi:hypothetical protein